jgi:TonB family protein
MATEPTKNDHEERATGHLRVRPDTFGPVELRFQFEQPRVGVALGAGFMVYAVVASIAFLIWLLVPKQVIQAVIPKFENIVWMADPGPGGGGGGGNKMPDPPKPAEIPKPKPAPEPEPVEIPEEPPPITPILPLQTLNALVTAPGSLESTQVSNSLGAGTGGGAGPGKGDGLGPGTGGGTGGGEYRPGNGVLVPTLLKKVDPQYTADAMRAKVQGLVVLECVVLADGTVGRVEVIRSLDSTFGLDQEAIKAAKQWRFRPGTRFGEPVAVLVTIELTFTLR